MRLEPGQVLPQAKTMIDALASANEPKDGAYGRVRRYLAGEQDPPYMPKNAKAEFKQLAERCVTNWLPLIADTYAKALFVDGYRPAKVSDNATAWKFWQANGLDARQSIAHRAALEYGVGYVLVLPGSGGIPSIRPVTPTRVWALYEDVDDEWPAVALIRKGRSALGQRIYELLDDDNVYTITRDKTSDELRVSATEKHNLNVVPLVRFRDRLDGENVGMIRPLMRLQDRVNEAVFALMVALQYASFRQRWATGLAVPMKEIKDDDGNVVDEIPVEPFESAVNRLWISDSTETRFGDFAQTDVQGHLSTITNTVQTLAAIAQTPPHVLLGDLVNLSADALAAAESSTQRKVGEYETIFGESWEQVFRLAAYAADDLEGALDTSSQVRWRDTEARSLSQTVDALGKIAQMLSVPPEVLWERIPGVTDGDVLLWKEAAGRADGLAALASVLDRQAAPVAEPEVAPVETAA